MSDNPNDEQGETESNRIGGCNCGHQVDGEGQEPEVDLWQTYVETTLNVSNRRLKNNRFYQSILGGTVAGVGIAAELGFAGAVAFMVVGVVGSVVSLLWMVHVISYQQLNSGKYVVLHQLESELPYDPFTREWNILDRGRNPETYVTHTSVEIWWPRVSIWVFGGLALYGVGIQFQLSEWVVYLLTGWTVVMVGYWLAAFRGWRPFELIAPHWKQRTEEDE